MCQEEFENLSTAIYNFYEEDKNFKTLKDKLLSSIELTHAIHKKPNGYGIGQYVKTNNVYYKTTIQILNKIFLIELKEFLEKDEKADLPECLIYALSLLKTNKDSSNIKEKAESFKNLYYETPEQMLVTEQRYYAQKRIEQQEKQHAEMLEQAAENARLERERQDRQAELDRQAAAEQAEENRNLQLMIAQEQAEREERYRKEEQRQRQQQQQRQQQMQYQQKRQRESDYRNAMNQCNVCANRGACRNVGNNPNCGAFRPRK